MGVSRLSSCLKTAIFAASNEVSRKNIGKLKRTNFDRECLEYSRSFCKDQESSGNFRKKTANLPIFPEVSGNFPDISGKRRQIKPLKSQILAIFERIKFIKNPEISRITVNDGYDGTAVRPDDRSSGHPEIL